MIEIIFKNIECQNEGEMLAVLNKISIDFEDARWLSGNPATEFTPIPEEYPVYIFLHIAADGIFLTFDEDKYNYNKTICEVRAEDYLHGEETIKLMGDPIEIQDDPVNHPSHYTSGKVECIDAMEQILGRDAVISFYMGNLVKYLWRRKDKGKEEEDTAKAIWYFDKAKELINR